MCRTRRNCASSLINYLTVTKELFLIQSPLYLLQFGARDHDCVLAERTGIGEKK